jgi:hypothetical protein
MPWKSDPQAGFKYHHRIFHALVLIVPLSHRTFHDVLSVHNGRAGIVAADLTSETESPLLA